LPGVNPAVFTETDRPAVVSPEVGVTDSQLPPWGVVTLAAALNESDAPELDIVKVCAEGCGPLCW
jgi:translation initiation factor IF-3